MATVNIGLKPVMQNIVRVRSAVHSKREFYADKRSNIANDGDGIVAMNADVNINSGKMLTAGRDYLKYIHKFEESGIPIIVTTNRSFAEVDKRKNVWTSPAVVVSNGGAVVVDPFGRELVNKKISKTAVESINKVLSPLSANGVVCLGTKEGVFADQRGGLRVLDPQEFGRFDATEFQNAQGDTNNICFNVLNKTEYAPHSTTFHFPFLEHFFYLKKGTLDLTFSINTPVLKSLFKRKKISLFDAANQQAVMSGAIKALLTADDEEMAHYIDEVDVTITAKGLCFVPKGVSKQSAIKKYCKLHSKNVDEVLMHGDSFDDFFSPVSLRELKKMYDRTKKTGQQFDPIQAVYSLAKCNYENPQEFFEHASTYMIVQNNSLSAKLLMKKMQEAEQAHDEDVLKKLKEEQLEQVKIRIDNQTQCDKDDLDEKYKPKFNAAKIEKARLKTEMLAKQKMLDDDYDALISAAPTADKRKELEKEKNLEKHKLQTDYEDRIKNVHELTDDEKKAIEKELKDKKDALDKDAEKALNEQKAKLDKYTTKQLPIEDQLMFECHNGGMNSLRGVFEEFSNVLALKKARTRSAAPTSPTR